MVIVEYGYVSEKGLEGWKGYTECHREGGVLSCHFRRACLPYSPCSCCLPQCQRSGRPHVTHAAHPFSGAWVNRDRAQCLRSVGRAGPVPLMARQLWVVSRQAKCCLPASSTRPEPIDQRLSGARIKPNFVAGQARFPRRSSWHRHPKFAGLLHPRQGLPRVATRTRSDKGTKSLVSSAARLRLPGVTFLGRT